jgi:hypothetical protein
MDYTKFTDKQLMELVKLESDYVIALQSHLVSCC